MIYVDTSVLLAHLLDEQHQPPVSLWNESLVTSRLTHFETWVNLHARGLAASQRCPRPKGACQSSDVTKRCC